MRYYMPTEVLEGNAVVAHNQNRFKAFGRQALLVTGKSSAARSGALADVIKALEATNIAYRIFDEVKANPLISQCADGAKVGRDCDFVIGIGGGSPLDTAKGIAILIKHGVEDYYTKLFGSVDYDALPVIAVPTTSGTGSEVTPYSVFTDDDKQTKLSMPRKVFPSLAFIDPRYFATMPKAVRNSTIMDAFSHAVESFVNNKADRHSLLYAEAALKLFGKNKTILLNNQVDEAALLDFIHASTYAGIAISQTGTTLPHSLGYPLTYHFGLEHGMANATFIYAFLKASPQTMVTELLSLCGFDNLESLRNYLDALIKQTATIPTISQKQLTDFVKLTMVNKAKLQAHPLPIGHEDLAKMYQESLGEITTEL